MQTLVVLISMILTLTCGYQIISQKKGTEQATKLAVCPGAVICYSYQSSRAVDGDINTCTRTKEIGSMSPVKWTWWYVDLENVLSIYSIRIQFKDYGEQYAMRQRGRFAGFSLYVSNTTTKEDGYLCYKNGQELPTLDFNTACVKHGRYVIFYNERLDGKTYPTGYQTEVAHTELCEITVTGCKESGVYGYNCDVRCTNNCQESRCDIVNGTCLGCTAGWVGEFCNKSCPAGYYGLQCGSMCTGHCRDNLSCNHTTGQCDYGCGNGWTGIHCNTECPAESYGPDCVYNCSGQCLSYLPCNRTTGRCDGGCNPGYTGELCEKGEMFELWFRSILVHSDHSCKCFVSLLVCSVGRYGLNCSEKCSSRCRSESNHCNHIDGHCEHGCDDGFQGSTCEEICDDGWYGENCSARCNENCVNQSCDHITGSCTYGCIPGWRTPNCKQKCSAGTYGKDCGNPCSIHCSNITCNPINGSCLGGCTSGYLGSLCNKSCDEGKYGLNCSQNCSQKCLGKCDNVDGSCTCSSRLRGFLDCSEKSSQSGGSVAQSDTTDSGAVTGAVGGAVGAVGLIAVLITGILFTRWRRKKARKHEDTETVTFSSVPETLPIGDKRHEEMEMSEIGNPGLELETEGGVLTTNTKIDISVADFDKAIVVLSENQNAKFKEEYMTIPRGELHPCNEGKKQENVAKNRYTTIFPYDHSRVVLTSSPKESDYINANYIEDVQGKKSYIAAQGPKSKTIVDFWKMVWQEDISVIVCLTNLKEGNKNKCAQYWPNSSDKIKKGNISIRNQKENVYADYVIRYFRLQNSADKAERDVCMFHYTQWPDHGVPEPLALVVFHRHVLKISVEHPGKYTLVHCSAGIGRTGTYIALDALNKGGEITGKVNIRQYVETMRNSRANMIQGDDQYRVVYLALLESFRGKGRSVSTGTFLREFQDHSCYINLGEVANKSPLSAEFQDLLSGRREYTQEDYKTGWQNVSANYTPSILPVESYMCPLSNTKGKNTYYNAVCLQSFTRNDHFISAQYPFPDYTEDFLRLVKAYYAPTIVSLSPLVEIESSSLWLPAKNESKTVGAFTTKMTDCTQTTTVTKTSITLHQQGASGMNVCVLECRRWKGESDSSNRRVLLDLVNEARVEERTHPEGRILVLSSDGAKRCGQFLVVFNALEQLIVDTEVDIFTITRQLQIRRPEFISSLEEYQFCYEAIADHLQNDTVYANC
ncbi:receptor-type tyrosine-protein phosphatase T-like [Ostrea edulis]|uniref:receptor-type tyrosine-protein phosphatase T-like n=1 Tax=Ostrea edulis TaxID=37623 RepID=UPI0024AF61D3|nr:receptor-type tyrosine-protein phosphatase T-like [Ostrea edulis]